MFSDDLSEFEDSREAVIQLSEEYKATERADFGSKLWDDGNEDFRSAAAGS
jgi:hypothetical protein